jgi:hypothetical protein
MLLRGTVGSLLHVLVAAALCLTPECRLQAQPPSGQSVWGNSSAGSQPVTLSVPYGVGPPHGIAYFVTNAVGVPPIPSWPPHRLQVPRLQAGQSRTYIPRGGRGIRVRFHNGSLIVPLRFADIRLYGGQYHFGYLPPTRPINQTIYIHPADLFRGRSGRAPR